MTLKLSYIFPTYIFVVCCIISCSVKAQLGSCRDALTEFQCRAFKSAGSCANSPLQLAITCPLTCEFCKTNGGPPCIDANPALCSSFTAVGCDVFGNDEIRTLCRATCTSCTPIANWGRWTAWSSCTATCGTGSSGRTRICSSGRVQDCGVLRSRETRTCNTQICRGGRLSGWSTWSSCSTSCNSGRSFRTRTCSTGQYVDCGTTRQQSTQEQSCFIRACVSYNWNRWSSWGQCSPSCGNNRLSTRTRTCNIGLVTNCGQEWTQQRQCNIILCPSQAFWTFWGQWSLCSGTCGEGQQTRTRRCSTGRASDCPGIPEFQTRRCNNPLICPTIAPSWGSWISWGECSVPCGIGVRTRIRFCNVQSNRQACGFDNQETDICNIHACPDPTWLSWNEWSDCSRSCGDGARSRVRDCSTGRSSDCFGISIEPNVCNLQRCPTQNQPAWNSWRSWEDCSEPCGGGTRIRRRECSSGRNIDCGSNNRQTEECNIHNCPRIVWTTWGQWGACTTTCGDEGSRMRTRICNSGKTSDCGAETETRQNFQCTLDVCPGTARWNEWTQWTRCTRSCNGGTRTRSRTCTSGRNADCGTLSSQRWRCNTMDCQSGRWSDWNSWSDCSRTCNSGTRMRNRTCSIGSNSRCPGGATNSRQSVNCNTDKCPQWNAWNNWSTCSASCGTGSRTRTRRCNSGDNTECSGQTSDNSDCNEQVCPPATWNSWSSWSFCTKSCDEGNRVRSRTCSTGRNLDCGLAFTETLLCNTQSCPIEAEWSDWSPWSICSSSCGEGNTTRSRTCSTGNNIDCGLSSRETLPCNTSPCPGNWNSWGQWSPCTVSCNGGIRGRSRACSTRNNEDCNGVSQQISSCNNITCSEWNSWSQWSLCAVSCGGGLRGRNRTCSTENNRDCIGVPVETSNCNQHNCPQWNSWSDWSACSTTCDVGTQTRIRTCNSGSNNDCSGEPIQISSCNDGMCPQWNSWSDWSACSTTCDVGTQTRIRTCNSGSNNDCSGEPIQISSCNDGMCPQWNSWNEWTVCTVTCGGGIRGRNRACNTGNDEDCDGNRAEISECNNRNCSVWNAWSSWSTCSVTCGVGSQNRMRTCDSGNDADCNGVARENSICNDGMCPEWNPWNEWSACAVTCGGGTRERNRVCNTGNNEDCIGDLSKLSTCNEQGCPGWSPWNNWSDCSVTCGVGSQARTRICDTGNNADCQGAVRENSPCNEGICPEWNSWSEWSLCTRTCGRGTRGRNRACNTGNDDNCEGEATAISECNEQNCAVWTLWSDWSSCSTTCGDGLQTRIRACISGNDCMGEAIESSACNDGMCTEWNTWSAWSPCTFTCGGGIRGRNRTCNTGNNEECDGEAIVVSNCNEEECFPGRIFWSDWSTCSTTCGIGSRTRRRICARSEARCNEETEETSSCFIQECPPLAMWSEWSSWSQCTNSCGGGTMQRVRICSPGISSDCEGSQLDAMTCNLQECPAWGDWSSWSRCSRTCGGGNSIRSRSCSTGNNRDCGTLSSETFICNTNLCPTPITIQWNGWGPWSQCSVTCGGGFRDRSRMCSTGNIADCGINSLIADRCNTQTCIDNLWSTWSSWSACDRTCGLGQRVRRRECLTSIPCPGLSSEMQSCNETICASLRTQNCRCSNSTDRNADESCEDDINGSCNVFRPFCDDFEVYAQRHCPRTCGLCSMEDEQCDCGPCSRCQRLRYGSSDGCCVFDQSKTCGIISNTTRALGTRGVKDQQPTWPWMVHIETPVSSCGGAMINSRWVIAAAHCLSNQNSEDVQVYFHDGSGIRASENFTAQYIDIHPSFRFNLAQGIIEYDVALIQLPANVPIFNSYATPICLPQGANVPSGWQCYIAEWNVSVTTTPKLNEASVEVVSNSNCGRAYNFIRDFMICAAGKNGSECRSDQGRSLMCQMCRSCEWYLVGISTTRFSANSCGTMERPDVYTRITSIEEWISEETGISVTQQRTTNCF